MVGRVSRDSKASSDLLLTLFQVAISLTTAFSSSLEGSVIEFQMITW